MSNDDCKRQRGSLKYCMRLPVVLTGLHHYSTNSKYLRPNIAIKIMNATASP